jgi:hypothetical protein
MIGSIYSGSSSIQVSGGSASTYINGYGGAQGVGNMRFNTSSQKTEVFDGTNWITLNMGTASVSLSGEVESLLEWARQKRNEELELDRLSETNLTIKDLVNQLKQKQDQIKMVRNLIKKENDWASESASVQTGP